MKPETTIAELDKDRCELEKEITSLLMNFRNKYDIKSEITINHDQQFFSISNNDSYISDTINIKKSL